MRTITGVVSVAVPLNDGVVSFDGGPIEFNVTAGEAVMIVNVTGEVVVLSSRPPSSACSATAV